MAWAVQGSFYKLFAFFSASRSRSITTLVLAWGFLKHVGIINTDLKLRCFDCSQETSLSTWVQDSDKLPHHFSGSMREIFSCLFFPLLPVNSPLMGISLSVLYIFLYIFKRTQSYIMVGPVSGPRKHPWGLPDGSVGNESACNAGDTGDVCSTSG